MTLRPWFALGVAALSLAHAASAASPAPLQASVLQHFSGDWVARGPLLGQPVCDLAHAHWVLDGQFLQLDLDGSPKGKPYHAMVFFGLDGKALTVHWLDVFGGGVAKVLGAGTLDAAGATMDFPYRDGAFRDRLSYDAAKDQWRLLIQTGSGAKTEVFSDWTFSRSPASCPG